MWIAVFGKFKGARVETEPVRDYLVPLEIERDLEQASFV